MLLFAGIGGEPIDVPLVENLLIGTFSPASTFMKKQLEQKQLEQKQARKQLEIVSSMSLSWGMSRFVVVAGASSKACLLGLINGVERFRTFSSSSSLDLPEKGLIFFFW